MHSTGGKADTAVSRHFQKRRVFGGAGEDAKAHAIILKPCRESAETRCGEASA